MKLLFVILEGHFYLAAVIAIFGAELAVLIWGLWSRRPLIGLVAVFAMVPLLRSTLAAVRVCFLSTPTPGGLTLRPSEGPGLFQLVEEIRDRLGGPVVDAVIITGG